MIELTYSTMDLNFGEFITKEYGLLKQILSYLKKPRDLYNARLVCREWRKAVDNLVERKPIVISYKEGQNDPMHCPAQPILPNLVIYQNVANKGYMKAKCPVCKRKVLLCYCEIAGPETGVLMLSSRTYSTLYSPELYSFWQLPSALLLSSPESIKINTFYCRKISPMETNHEFLCNIDDTVKGMFLIVRKSPLIVPKMLQNEVIDRHGPIFAMGGGVCFSFCYQQNVLHGLKNKFTSGGVCIIFKGNNVTAHSELISERDEVSIEETIAKLRERAGEVPEGGTRFALIAQCVERRGLEELENGLLRKYFPNMHQCGFRAYGEYGMKNISSDDSSPRNKRRRKKIDLLHVQTTSIMIITLLKPRFKSKK